ncbi:TPA: hypothetical protein BOS_3811 [Bos taurus]|nr:TPA: hypothetical protein BOS_3811 [Bos taurus]
MATNCTEYTPLGTVRRKDTRSSQRHISGSEKMHQRANWTLKVGPEKPLQTQEQTGNSILTKVPDAAAGTAAKRMGKGLGKQMKPSQESDGPGLEPAATAAAATSDLGAAAAAAGAGAGVTAGVEAARVSCRESPYRNTSNSAGALQVCSGWEPPPAAI